MIKKIIWEFDLFIYKLFYWRWNPRLINNPDLRKLFLNYLLTWDVIEKEPAMGIGKPPQFPFPKRNTSFRKAK